DELLDHRQRHIGFEERHANLAHRLIDIGFRQRPAPAQAVEGVGQALLQRVEHESSLPKHKRPRGRTCAAWGRSRALPATGKSCGFPEWSGLRRSNSLWSSVKLCLTSVKLRLTDVPARTVSQA